MKNKNEIADYLRELANRIEGVSPFEIDIQEFAVTQSTPWEVEFPVIQESERILTLRWKETIP